MENQIILEQELLDAIQNPLPRFVYRQQYDLATELVAHDQTKFHSDKPSKTQTHFKDDVNLNVMLKRMGVKDGSIPPQALDPRYFGNFLDVPDFRQAMDNVRDAIDRFNQLPADIKNRFHNDPAALYEFVMKPENAEESLKLGLLKREAPIVETAIAERIAQEKAAATTTAAPAT